MLSNVEGSSVFGEEDEHDDNYSVVSLAEEIQDREKTEQSGPCTPSFHKATFSTLEKPSKTLSGSTNDGNDMPALSEEFTGSADFSDVPCQVLDSFTNFASMRFQFKATPVYSCAALPNPLLRPKDRTDHLAAMASWVTMLRIMGDMPDRDHFDILRVAGTNPDALSKVKLYFGKKYTKKDVEDTQKKYSELFKDPTNSEISGISFLSDNKESMLEKVQYICMMGIYRPEIRDELYCQLCKQLTNNPSRNSAARGWVLLYLFAGCFAPTERFASCLIKFLQDGPPEFAPQCEKLLRHTFVNGTRGYPPSWLEFQAAKNNKPLLLPVSLMGGQRLLVHADPTTTLNQFCRQIANKIGLRDRIGFSVYITLFKKISCLGHGLHRIMDAVAECEIYTKQMGMRESSATWRLYFRREFFPPWHVPGGDMASVDLTYHQVMRGISVTEYRCDTEEETILMAARKFCLEHAKKAEPKKAEEFLTSWLPESCLQHKPVAQWMDQFSRILALLQSQHLNTYDVKEEIVKYAKDRWTMLFSRCYDLTKLQGPGFQWNGGVLAINYQGFYAVDESDNIKIQLPFLEITDVARESRQMLTLSTVKGEHYTITSPHCDDMFNLLLVFVDGLQQRSIFAVALENISKFGSPAQSVTRGDLIILDKPWEDVGQASEVSGICKRTGLQGMMPKHVVYILTTTTEPSAEFLGLLAVHLQKVGGLFSTTSRGSGQYTLENYAKQHFRRTGEGSVSKFLSKASFKRKSGQCSSWLHSKDQLKRPMLRKLQIRPDTHGAACAAFTSILQYMGDTPVSDRVDDRDLVGATIIEPAIRNRYIRDEVFCQVLKQISGNPDVTSEERGWHLLWLLCGITYPGSELHEECVKFLKSSKHTLAGSCLQRLASVRSGGSRNYPPHKYEHEAIAAKATSITVHVHFPDKTSNKYEITSTSRAYDLCSIVSSDLGLRTSEEYSIFFRAGEKVVSIPDDEYILDYISFADMYWAKRESRITHRPPRLTLFFMKKLWVNASPESDPVADLKFHFTQELPNYLRGYHKVSMEDAVKLAAFLSILRKTDGEIHLGELQNNLRQILPRDLLNQRTTEEWIKDINDSIQSKSSMTQNDAKKAFLKIVGHWPTYGSVFFEVKQRSAKANPKDILLAINANGVFLLDKTSKDILVTYGYSKIPNWQYDNHLFTLLLGDTINTTRMVLETTLGHNIDDLIMAYITWLMNYHMRHHSKAGSPASQGESYC